MTKAKLEIMIVQWSKSNRSIYDLIDELDDELATEERRRTTPDNLTHIPQMTLRDWFAGQALAGMTASPKGKFPEQLSDEQAAKDAYELADAMLAARGKP
jgi:hypothetical protein